MKYRTLLGVVMASALALTSVTIYAAQHGGAGASGDRTQQMDRDRDFDRDRIQDRDRLDQDQDRDQDRDQDQVRDRTHLQDPSAIKDAEIYGSDLMSEEERNQYRKQLQNMKTVEERNQYQAQHEKMMQERAQQQGKDLVPPGQGPIYGGELMTVQERNQYRERLRQIGTDEERTQFMAQHREKMELRAKALEREVEEAE
jgi:hypothetical protein